MGYKILYTGDGGGKTIAALGLALRALGHGKRVVFVQFMKGRKDTGEFLACKRLSGCEFVQFGRVGFVDLANPSDEDKQLAHKGFDFARDALKKAPDMLVLDEVNLAVSVGLLKTDDVVDLVSHAPEKTILVLTGRDAPKALMAACDIVTKIEDIKTVPLKERKGPEKGFEF